MLDFDLSIIFLQGYDCISISEKQADNVNDCPVADQPDQKNPRTGQDCRIQSYK